MVNKCVIFIFYLYLICTFLIILKTINIRGVKNIRPMKLLKKSRRNSWWKITTSDFILENCAGWLAGICYCFLIDFCSTLNSTPNVPKKRAAYFWDLCQNFQKAKNRTTRLSLSYLAVKNSLIEHFQFLSIFSFMERFDLPSLAHMSRPPTTDTWWFFPNSFSVNVYFGHIWVSKVKLLIEVTLTAAHFGFYLNFTQLACTVKFKVRPKCAAVQVTFLSHVALGLKTKLFVEKISEWWKSQC